MLDLVEAHEAADAFAYGLRLAGLRLFAPLRVREMPARDAHQVAAALRQDRLRDRRLLNVRYRDDRYPHVLLNLSCHVFFPSLLDRARLDAGGELGAVRDRGADVEEVGAGLLQFGCDPAARGEVVPLVSQEFLGREADAEREALAAGRADAREDLQQEPQAVLEVAAIIVVTPVEIRGQEAVDQVAMRAVQLDAVGARHLRQERPFHERLLDLSDLRDRESARRLSRNGVYHRRGGDGLLASDHDAALAAGVLQLDEHPGAVLVHRVHEPPEPLHVRKVSRGELAGFSRARAVHDSA